MKMQYIYIYFVPHSTLSEVRVPDIFSKIMWKWDFPSYNNLWLSSFCFYMLTHCGRVTHICIDKLTNIGLDNGLSPGRRQAIIWNNAAILLIGPLGTVFSEILIVIHTFSFKKMHLKMASVKWRPFCLGLNVLIRYIKFGVTSLVWNKMEDILKTFSIANYLMKILDKHSTEVYSQVPDWQQISSGSGNGLALPRPQTIVWNHRWPSSLTYWCITQLHCVDCNR